MDQDKEKVLKLTTDQIEQKFGKGSIMTLGKDGQHLEIGVIPTGSLPLDAALGIGGVPRGRDGDGAQLSGRAGERGHAQRGAARAAGAGQRRDARAAGGRGGVARAGGATRVASAHGR